MDNVIKFIPKKGKEEAVQENPFDKYKERFKTFLLEADTENSIILEAVCIRVTSVMQPKKENYEIPPHVGYILAIRSFLNMIDKSAGEYVKEVNEVLTGSLIMIEDILDPSDLLGVELGTDNDGTDVFGLKFLYKFDSKLDVSISIVVGH